MDNVKKMQFIAHMTAQALNHVARTPNAISPKGEMSHDKKLGFVHKMTKEGLQHFDSGGAVLSGPGTATTTQNATNPNTGFLGTINGALGLNNGFQASGANIQQGTNSTQLNNAYTGAQGGLGAQGSLQSTLAPQAQSAVNAQNTLSQQYANEAAGQGPNPAQAELAQATGQNVAATNAAIAGARGGSQNIGLLARQAAQAGANTQQNAVGQAATLQAQQQLAAQNAQANLANNQISQTGQATTGLNSAQQNEQGILQNANTSANNAAVSQQGNINNVNASTSAANQNMAGNLFGGITSALSSVSSLFAEGGEVDAPNLGTVSDSSDSASPGPTIGSDPLPADQTNFASAVNKPSNPLGGSGGAGGIAALAALARGGSVSRMAGGGGPIVGNPLLANPSYSGPVSFAGQYLNQSSATSGPNIGSSSLPGGTSDLSKSAKVSGSKSSNAPPSNTGAGDFVTPDDATAAGIQPATGGLGDVSGVMAVARGGFVPDHNMKAGGRVIPKNAAEKAKVKGDSYSNDTVPAMLSAGEVVIDRDTMKDPGPMGQMARLLAAHLNKKKKAS